MKKLLCILLFAVFLMSLSSCIFGGGGEESYSEDAMDYTQTEKTSVPKQSDTADGDNILPTPTPKNQVFEKKNIRMKLGKSAKVNGYTVTIASGENEGTDFVYAACEGQTIYISDGYFERAYLVGRETGKTAVIVCVMNEGLYTTTVYRINREKKHLFYKTAQEIGTLKSLTDATVTIAKNMDMFGTWPVRKDFTLTDKFKFEALDSLWTVTINENRIDERNLTVLCDLRAREFESGKNTAILEGSVLTVEMIDGDLDYAVLRDIASNFLYKIYVEPDGYGGYLLEDVGAEEGCFDNIQYWE